MNRFTLILGVIKGEAELAALQCKYRPVFTEELISDPDGQVQERMPRSLCQVVMNCLLMTLCIWIST